MNSKLPNIMMVPRQSGRNPSAIRAFPSRKREKHVEGPYLACQLSVSGLGVQALTSDESVCPLNRNGDVRKHRGFILVQALDALCPVRESESVLPCS